MQQIQDLETRRRLALGLTIPPPSVRNRRRRRMITEDAILTGMCLWLAGWILALAIALMLHP